MSSERTTSDTMAAGQPVAKEDLLQRARTLIPSFRERAQAAEDARRLPQESVDDMLRAQFARTLVPRRFGGYELGLDTMFEVVRELARADASHAWCAGLLISFGHMVAYFPGEAQEAVWSAGPNVPIAGSVPPVCTVTPADGGYRVSGRAPFSSGVWHSTWVVVSGMIRGDGPPDWCFFLLPPGDYEVEDTWFTAAMRATGSNTIVVDDVLVPASRVLRLADYREGTAPGGQVNESRLYQLPWTSHAPTHFLATMLGAVRGSYEQFRDWTRDRVTSAGASVADYTSVQVRMGGVAADLDAAELLIERAIAETQGPRVPSLETRTRSMRDFARAAQLMVAGIDTLLAMSGTAGFASSNALQRAWRDVHFIASHVSLNAEIYIASWARAELGLERPPTQLIY